MNTVSDLTHGNYKSKLLKFALPYVGAYFLQAFYGATDLFVVGKFNGTSAISAVTIGSQIMLIITGFIVGCAMGSTVLIGRTLGANDKHGAANALGNTIIFFTIIAAVLTPVMIIFTPNLIYLLHTPAEAVNEALKYTLICSIGIPFITVFNVIAAVFRGTGDSKTPLKIVAVACVVNIFGDLLLTGYLKMDTAGVGIATTAAQLISSVFGITILVKKCLPFEFSRKNIKFNKRSLGKIATTGFPVAAQDTLINISFILLTVIANNRGLTASSAVGVVEKVASFIYMVPASMLSSISALTAQNRGAGNVDRAVKTTKFGICITAIFGILMLLLAEFVPQIFNGIFTSDPEVLKQANEYIKTYAIDFVLVAFVFCINGYLCGCEKSFVTFIHNVLSVFCIRIPVAWILSNAFPHSLEPMGLASPLGSVLSLIILGLYFLLRKHRLQNAYARHSI